VKLTKPAQVVAGSVSNQQTKGVQTEFCTPSGSYQQIKLRFAPIKQSYTNQNYAKAHSCKHTKHMVAAPIHLD
jgi:hypothetical protein